MNDDVDIEDLVAGLAELVLREGLCPAFRRKAQDAAKMVDADDIDEFKYLFHNPPPEPADFDTAVHGLGGWLSACQFAAFELIYAIGEPALPFLKPIAWGPYDWTQGNAIELLIRFAAAGIQKDELINEIKALFPDVRYEAQLYAVEPLLPRLATEEGLKAVVDRLRAECVAFNDICKEVSG